VSLTDIAVIDLKSVHRLVPNSPSVNLACGKVVATTSVRVRLFLVQFYFVVVVVVVYFQFIMLELEHWHHRFLFFLHIVLYHPFILLFSISLSYSLFCDLAQAADNAGKMANWENLNIVLPLDKSATIRVLISSRDKVIGQCTVSRSKLLGGRKNQKGCFVVRVMSLFLSWRTWLSLLCLFIVGLWFFALFVLF
jgi:hypothetical protein